DFDIFWSDAGPNQIWLQNPVGTFTASAKPVIPGTPDIDGCACGDVDLDGDTDLFLGNNSGNSYLFINTTSIQNDISALSFAQMDIPVNADAEGVNMIDYDGDGDYDLYVNVNNGPNQIWESDKCDGGCNFLNIVMNDCIDGTMVTRPVVGATVVLKDTNGNIVSAKVDGSTASGHGAQNPLALLIAIPNPNQDYIVDITFPVKGNNPPETHSYQFNLSQLTTPNTLELVAANGNNGSFCSFSILPVELLYFTAENNNEGVLLKWTTATELNNDHFIIERSHNGKIFEELAQVQGNGTTQTKNAYSYLDPYPYDGFNYYRLAQYDYDGRATKHRIIRVKVESKRGDGIGIYPNPVRDQLTINFSEQWQGSRTSVTINDLQGNKIFEQEVAPLTNKINIPWSQSVEGFYWVKISNQQQTVIKKLVKVSP
ncbi:MAG TPA: T9SS type A sorting domain-containing protein, partial [Cyclobacteriaceae bacterium]|nr:T9SS type A sorting domain-containing protein [Cyclobacteriaceae bacterium]